jgi:hypothetical protein
MQIQAHHIGAVKSYFGIIFSRLNEHRFTQIRAHAMEFAFEVLKMHARSARNVKEVFAFRLLVFTDEFLDGY